VRLILAALVAYIAIIGSIGLIQFVPQSLMLPAAIAAVAFAILLTYVLFDRDALRRFFLSHERYVRTELKSGRA
jgi:hypothetical protein